MKENHVLFPATGKYFFNCLQELLPDYHSVFLHHIRLLRVHVLHVVMDYLHFYAESGLLCAGFHFAVALGYFTKVNTDVPVGICRPPLLQAD